MIVVEIHDPEDGRVSHEVAPEGGFGSRASAVMWRRRFLLAMSYDPGFVEVRDVDRRLTDPESGWDDLMEFYGGSDA